MKVIFTSNYPYIPQSAGGVESSTHELAGELSKLGHDVSVLCGVSAVGWVGFRARVLRKLQRKPYVKDRILGYPVYRHAKIQESLTEVVREIAPDVAIIPTNDNLPAFVAEFEKCGVPIVIYLRNVEAGELGALATDAGALSRYPFVSNSQFTANRYKEAYGITSTVIPPMFFADRYRTQSAQTNVTFINPRPIKGLDIAFSIAEQCPEIPFRFIESWPLSDEESQAIQQRARIAGNVTLDRRTFDMKSVYRQAKILLAPSQWEEAWGRVVSEAHYSGIPVVASTRGGLPESVGPGGVLLDPEGPIELWVEAVRRLWNDPVYYKEKSAAALAYSGRPELDPKQQASSLLKIARQAVEMANRR